MISKDFQRRINSASPKSLQALLRTTQAQLLVHQHAADDTRQTKDKRNRAQFHATRCKEKIEAIETRQKHELEKEHLAIAGAAFDQAPKRTSGNKAYAELLQYEDDLMRAQYSEMEFRIKAEKATTRTDQIRNNDLATYWLKRADNATSRINEFIVNHKDDFDKPWLAGSDRDDSEPLH